MNVELIDHMGSDLSVVNAARVSFDKESDWYIRHEIGAIKELSDRDTKLIQFLARGMTAKDFDEFVTDVSRRGYYLMQFGSSDIRDELIRLLERYRDTPEHWSPFAHCFASFRVQAPVFVARQLQKHTVGLSWNEVSRRYVDSEPSFYTPKAWRKRAENVKQGSSEETVDRIYFPWEDGTKTICELDDLHQQSINAALRLYNAMLSDGVCPEQARMVLPQSMMTEWIWSGSLYAFARVCNLRLDSHTQKETQLVAQQISSHMESLFPVSWRALVSVRDTATASSNQQ
jgi:thymidylate synthase (FAD)